jgi:outer membrane lipoprotein-sorting protein
MKTILKRLNMSIIILMLVALPTMAQGTAEVWLDKATERLRNKGTEISFRIDEEGVRLTGKLLIDGENFLYDTDDMKIWYDGTTQWTLQMGSGYNELYINNPTPEEQQQINPYLLLKGYKEHFTPEDGGTKSLNGTTTHQVVLKAKDDSQETSEIYVYINSDATLAAIEFAASDGSVYEIDVRSMRNGLTFPKDTFVFPTDGYHVDETIDMR